MPMPKMSFGNPVKSFHDDLFLEQSGLHKKDGSLNKVKLTMYAVAIIGALVAFVAACMLIHQANAKLYTNGMTYKAHVIQHAQMVAAGGAGALALVLTLAGLSKAYVKGSDAYKERALRRREATESSEDEAPPAQTKSKWRGGWGKKTNHTEKQSNYQSNRKLSDPVVDGRDDRPPSGVGGVY